MAKGKRKGLNVHAVTREIEVSSSVSGIIGGEIVKFGLDNLYPNRVREIRRGSPTASGCVKRKTEFIVGLGTNNPERIVNRHGQTLNDVVRIASEDYTEFDGFALHFNVNLVREITEIQNVDLRYLRKTADLKKVRLSKLKTENLFDDSAYEIPLWGSGGSPKNGYIFYFNRGRGIYPTCPFEASLTSAQFEDSSQVFSYMNAENGFSASGLLKIPNLPESDKKKRKIEEQVKKVVGSKSAGSVLLVNAPQNIEGEIDGSKMFEPFQLSNVDSLHTKQTERAREYILRDFNMPEILLGVGSNGMFNKESFEDAHNYYNSDTERDRKIIERAFNSFLPFAGIEDLEIIPLEKLGEETKTGEGKE